MLGGILCWQDSLWWSGPTHYGPTTGEWEKTQQTLKYSLLRGSVSYIIKRKCWSLFVIPLLHSLVWFPDPSEKWRQGSGNWAGWKCICRLPSNTSRSFLLLQTLQKSVLIFLLGVHNSLKAKQNVAVITWESSSQAVAFCFVVENCELQAEKKRECFSIVVLLAFSNNICTSDC